MQVSDSTDGRLLEGLYRPTELAVLVVAAGGGGLTVTSLCGQVRPAQGFQRYSGRWGAGPGRKLAGCQ